MSRPLTIPVLETDRLILRAPDARDMAPMIGFFMSDHARFYGGPMTKCDAWYKFSAYVGQWVLRGYGFYAVTLKQDGTTIGMAGPHQPAHFSEPEMSWLLVSPDYQGQGFAHEACVAVLEHLFNTQGWDSVISYIDRDNAASLALAQRLGAQLDPQAVSPLPGCDGYRHVPTGARA